MEAGDVIFVPRGWWHCVMNLTESVAVTQNFCSPTNLPAVLRYLDDHPQNISGLDGPDADAARAALPRDFRAALATHRPDLLVRCAAGGEEGEKEDSEQKARSREEQQQQQQQQEEEQEEEEEKEQQQQQQQQQRARSSSSGGPGASSARPPRTPAPRPLPRRRK